MKKQIIVAIAAISLVCCKKPEKGEIGPAGQNGNANVSTFNFEVPAWQYNGTVYYYDYYNPEMDNSASVTVYLKQANYQPLPTTDALGGNVTYSCDANNTNLLHLYVNYTSVGSPTGTNTFKVVCIP